MNQYDIDSNTIVLIGEEQVATTINQHMIHLDVITITWPLHLRGQVSRKCNLAPSFFRSSCGGVIGFPA